MPTNGDSLIGVNPRGARLDRERSWCIADVDGIQSGENIQQLLQVIHDIPSNQLTCPPLFMLYVVVTVELQSIRIANLSSGRILTLSEDRIRAGQFRSRHMAIRRILVAVKDPIAARLAAVNKAAQIASAFGARIELFHDMTATLYTGFPGRLASDVHVFARELRAARLDQLERIANALSDRGLRVSVAAEWDYPAHEAIVRRALAIKADLIVAQHHPGQRRVPWLLRFTDWELLRLSPVPVLLVKSSRLYRHPVVLAAIDPFHAFDKPTKLDARILRMSALMTKGLAGKLNVVHAYTIMPTGAVPAVVADPRISMDMEREARRAAGVGFGRALRAIKIPRAGRHLIGGDPANVIPAVARKVRSAIVVLGAISRSGIKRAFIGNTAERLIDEMQSDLLVVKPVNFRIQMPRTRRGVRVDPSPALIY